MQWLFYCNSIYRKMVTEIKNKMMRMYMMRMYMMRMQAITVARF